MLGAGGMGEVYRARDATLNRDVAIKVLIPALATDPDRAARFQREAQVLAALNHPQIGAIYGFVESTVASTGSARDRVGALVMELVEGPTLADRLASGPLPIDEALAIARQIADALQAAHEQGIVHRDLKPANIKVRADGTVKVLDFGLAKALDSAGSSLSAALAESPTITSPAMAAGRTGAGVILGTAPYMSPEQARGKVVDKRTDLWAFGCVLFEMLTGTRPFGGEDVTETIAAVVRADPEWERLPAETPAAIRRLLRRCLEKDRARRLSDAADARLEIDDASRPVFVDEIGSASQRAPSQGSVTAGWRFLPWVLSAGLTVAVAVLWWAPWQNAMPSEPLRLSADLGADVLLTTTPTRTGLSMSPDGSSFVFLAQQGVSGRTQLHVRRLNQLQATALPGTDDADAPFFSPDGRWIAFFAAGKLKKALVSGGSVISLCDAPSGVMVGGGTWSDDGTIVFASRDSQGGNLMRVSSEGGAVESVPSPPDDHSIPRWPQILPGGRAILSTGTGANGSYSDGNLLVQLKDGAERKVVLRGGYYGRYVASGHLLYIHDGTLFAAPFDLDRLEVTGQSVPVVEAVAALGVTGGAQYSVSSSGALVYLPGTSATGVPVYWLDREGHTTPLRAAPAEWFNARFAPDGQRIALQIYNGKTIEIWSYEWTRDALTRVTADGGNKTDPVWTPDGRRLTFASDSADTSTTNLRLRKRNLYWQSADGTGEAGRLTDSANHQLPGSWHPSGRFLVFEEEKDSKSRDVMILPLEGDAAAGWTPGKPRPFASGPATKHEPKFSPDGRWIAYTSDESGRDEVYVRPFPGPGGKWQISGGGGHFPIWSPTKPELFYGHEGQIMVTPFVADGEAFRAEKPRLWSESRYVSRGPFDLHPDGARFAIAAPAQTRDGARPDHLTFVFNLFDELRRLTAAVKR